MGDGGVDRDDQVEGGDGGGGLGEVGEEGGQVADGPAGGVELGEVGGAAFLQAEPVDAGDGGEGEERVGGEGSREVELVGGVAGPDEADAEAGALGVEVEALRRSSARWRRLPGLASTGG